MNEPTPITSRDNPLLVRLRKLAQDATAYRKQGQVWLEGDHLCSALVQRGGQAAQAVVSDSGWKDRRLRQLAGRAAKVAVVPDALFAGISGLESPAAIGFVLDLPAAPALLPAVPTVVLDRLQDAGNVGSILRSASAFGFAQVLALKGTAALWSPKVLRAGMGAHFALRLVEGLSDGDVLSLGLNLVGTSSHDAQPLHQAALPRPAAWLMGHEGQGVSARLLNACGLTVGIPQPGGEESLNVAAAAAICLYEALRQRQPTSMGPVG